MITNKYNLIKSFGNKICIYEVNYPSLQTKMILLPSVKLSPLITASFKGGGLPQSTLAHTGGGDAHSPDDSHFSSMAPCNLYTKKNQDSQYLMLQLDCIRTNHTICKCFPVYTRGRQPNAHVPTLAQ